LAGGDELAAGSAGTGDTSLLEAALLTGGSFNPLSLLDDEELWNTQLMLALACARSHSSLTRKRRQFFCLLQQVLKVESDLRGVPAPSAPYHAPSDSHLAL